MRRRVLVFAARLISGSLLFCAECIQTLLLKTHFYPEKYGWGYCPVTCLDREADPRCFGECREFMDLRHLLRPLVELEREARNVRWGEAVALLTERLISCTYVFTRLHDWLQAFVESVVRMATRGCNRTKCGKCGCGVVYTVYCSHWQSIGMSSEKPLK